MSLADTVDARGEVGHLSQNTRKLAGPSCVRWVPTSELELYNAEAAILGPIRPIISQRTVAGLNTIGTIHEKVRNGSPVRMFNALPPRHCDKEADVSALPTPSAPNYLTPLDADNFTSVVCIHGFAGGVANWLPIWRSFAESHDVYAFDLPGFARSERSSHVKGFSTAGEALEWFMGYFKRWFDLMKLGKEESEGTTRVPQEGENNEARTSSNGPKKEQKSKRRIVLMGHSFGGYLASMFAVRYPHLVDGLILADPWGIPRYTEPSKEKDPEEYAFRTSLRVRFFSSVFKSLGAGGILRCFGPAGRKIIPKVRPDFGERWASLLDDPSDFYEYTYHCNAAPCRIGEMGFISLGVTPKHPFFPLVDELPRLFLSTSTSGCERINGVIKSEANADDSEESAFVQAARSPFSSTPPTAATTAPHSSNNNSNHKGNKKEMADKTTPAAAYPLRGTGPRRLSKVTVLFGSSSWMFSDDVSVMMRSLEAAGADCSLEIVSNAGHQIMSDNPKEFSERSLASIRRI